MKAVNGTFLLLLCITGIGGQTERPALDYPLALKTRWIYHLHHENGEGVNFGPDMAALAKGKVLDATVVSEAVAQEMVGAHSYTRIESRLNGKPWLFEWARLSPDGFLIGKTIDYEQEGQEVIMEPEQKRISTVMRPGTFWLWQPKEAPVRFRYSVVGPGAVEVPAGHYQGTHLNTSATVDAPFGKVEIHQDTWFVPGVGIAKQDSTTTVQGHTLSHVILTLEKFENSPK